VSSETAAASAKVQFPGLNSLRFLAAFFVVLGHVPLNQESLGLPHPNGAAFFYRGAFAVSFFFTLSGFLITYLLLDERQRTGDIRIRAFYLRRVCRIWPLYFAVVFFGLFFYNGLMPLLGMHYRIEYRLSTALVLYTLLLPNLMNSLYTVGGLLNPSWSIGVEEQFYLLWAPAVKRVRDRLPALCWAVFAVSLLFFSLAHYNVFGPYEWKKFVGQLKFHFMAAGALCAWFLHRRRAGFLRLPVFASRLLQVALFALLLDFYLLSLIPWGWLGEELLQLLLYSWLLVNVAANPRNVLPLDNRVFDYLGTISYGIYMLHMVAVYTAAEVFLRSSWWRGGSLVFYGLAYYGLVLGLTFLLAHLSYRWFELPFLRLKDRRFSLLPMPETSSPAPSAP